MDKHIADTAIPGGIVTTALAFDGYQVTKYLGVARGTTVRSRSFVGNMGASIQQFFGGHISIYTEMCDHARQGAYDLMIQHAENIGANALIGVNYDATEIAPDVTEVLAYRRSQILPQTPRDRGARSPAGDRATRRYGTAVVIRPRAST